MKIGLNLLYLLPGVVGGTETYARGLIAGLQKCPTDHDFVMFLNRESAELKLADSPRFSSVICPVNASHRMDRYLFEQVKLRKYVKQEKIDLLHSLGYISPLFVDCPTVVTVHDLNFKAFGNLMPLGRRLMLSFFVKQSILRAWQVITVSEFSRQEILRAYRISPQKIIVTHEAYDPAFLVDEGENGVETQTAIPGVTPPYICAFSSTYPNKNIPALIEAFLVAKRKYGIPQTLVLIGHPMPIQAELQNQKETGGRESIVWTGYINRASVINVLRHADFLAFPSLYEGFGLPVLEAQAAGIPVVCSRTASLPEVAGDAAEYFNPHSMEDMTQTIGRIAKDPDALQRMRKSGRENLKRFSWEKTARETLNVCDSLLASTPESDGSVG